MGQVTSLIITPGRADDTTNFVPIRLPLVTLDQSSGEDLAEFPVMIGTNPDVTAIGRTSLFARRARSIAWKEINEQQLPRALISPVSRH